MVMVFDLEENMYVDFMKGGAREQFYKQPEKIRDSEFNA